jgi:tetratricopeptide (TPR) repeat protein
MLGDLEEAQRCIEDGMRKAAASHSQVGLVDIQRVQALALIQQRRWVEARAVLDQALQSARSMPYPYTVARLLYAYGLMHLEMGEQAQAQQCLDEGRAVFQRLGARVPSGDMPATKGRDV